MKRATGNYLVTSFGGEEVRAFVPIPLPPANPSLILDDDVTALHADAAAAVARLGLAGTMIPNSDWFLYGFVRKEAVVSSQIEGTQATLQDVVTFEATQSTDRPDDVEEVCNYVTALSYARREIRRDGGLPLSTRLLCEMHKRLLKGTRGAEQEPGEIRRSQNRIGGTRPGTARFVPAPPQEVPRGLAELEHWIHADDSLPPLVRAGLAHVQFETIHPFLDGNGRIGRMLVSLLVERWGILSAPLLYLSLPLKRRREEYYARLSAVRTDGDWEGWTRFFLESIRTAADDGVAAAQELFARLGKDRETLLRKRGVTIHAMRLFDQLPDHPVVTLQRVIKLLKTTKPTASKSIQLLQSAGILREISGRKRDRVYAYHRYLEILTAGT